jgi:hypothetical protein
VDDAIFMPAVHTEAPRRSLAGIDDWRTMTWRAAQKLGGVTQNSTTAGIVPLLTFQ